MEELTATFLVSKLKRSLTDLSAKEASLQLYFDSSVPSSIPLLNYISRFSRLLTVSASSLLMSCVLVERVTKAGLKITPSNVHRVFLTCVLVASKYLEDDFQQHATFAIAGGVRPEQLTLMEIALLRILRFDVWVDPLEISLMHESILQLDVPSTLIEVAVSKAVLSVDPIISSTEFIPLKYCRTVPELHSLSDAGRSSCTLAALNIPKPRFSIPRSSCATFGEFGSPKCLEPMFPAIQRRRSFVRLQG